MVSLSRRLEQALQLAKSLCRTDAKVVVGLLDEDTLSTHLAHATLLVNCTPAGMWPDIDVSPLPKGTRLHPGLLVYDLVYNPRPTRLLRQATTAGCRTQDGLSMLINQGAAAFKIWTGIEAPVEIMRKACEET